MRVPVAVPVRVPVAVPVRVPVAVPVRVPVAVPVRDVQGIDILYGDHSLSLHELSDVLHTFVVCVLGNEQVRMLPGCHAHKPVGYTVTPYFTTRLAFNTLHRSCKRLKGIK